MPPFVHSRAAFADFFSTSNAVKVGSYYSGLRTSVVAIQSSKPVHSMETLTRTDKGDSCLYSNYP
jgi:hypothetical protein